MITSIINQPLPPLSISAWVQGDARVLDDLNGRVVLMEFFQVNCPGCFTYSLPQAIRLHERYADDGLVVIGVATAFEDFEQNTLENLQRLIENGEVIGDTLKVLSHQGQLQNGRLAYRLPFPVAMDRLKKSPGVTSVEDIDAFVSQKLPDFLKYTEETQLQLRQQIQAYLEKLEYQAETFERLQLRGTPSHILVDKTGLIRRSEFGAYPELEADIQLFLGG